MQCNIFIAQLIFISNKKALHTFECPNNVKQRQLAITFSYHSFAVSLSFVVKFIHANREQMKNSKLQTKYKLVVSNFFKSIKIIF